MLTLDTGLQQMSWSHAAPVDVGVPDVQYDLVGGGIGWERALGTRWLILGVRVGVAGLLSAGDIADADAVRRRRRLGARSSTAAGRRAPPIGCGCACRRTGTASRCRSPAPARASRKSAADNWVGGALEVGFAL